MNYFDLIIAIPLLWAAYKGFRKGLVVEICSLIALALGIYGGIHFSDRMSALLRDHLGLTTEFLPVIAFALTFLLIVAGVHLLGRLVERMLALVAMKTMNKLLGSVFGILKVGLIIGVLLVVLNALDERASFFPKEVREKSLLYEPLSQGVMMVIPALKESELFEVVSPDESLGSREALFPRCTRA